MFFSRPRKVGKCDTNVRHPATRRTVQRTKKTARQDIKSYLTVCVFELLYFLLYIKGPYYSSDTQSVRFLREQYTVTLEYISSWLLTGLA